MSVSHKSTKKISIVRLNYKYFMDISKSTFWLVTKIIICIFLKILHRKISTVLNRECVLKSTIVFERLGIFVAL